MKKRFLIYGCLAIIAIIWIGSRFFGPGSMFVPYCRIHAGMTASEVEALLDINGNGPAWRSGTPIRVPNQGWIEGWQGYATTITIVYDTRGCVVEKDWNASEHQGSLLNDIARQMGVRQVRE
jgi:hypothetical protein